METGPETGRRVAQACQFSKDLPGQFVEIIGPAVGQRPFRLAPNPFVRIQFGSVAGKILDVKTRVAVQQAANLPTLVDLAVVPKQDDMAGQMPQEMSQKGADFRSANVLPMEPIVEGDLMAFGTDRQRGNQRHFAVPIAVSCDRRPTPGRPRPADGSEQQEARFVNEDEVGAQVQSPFFMRGHSSRFHCSIRSSLRSRARRSGFWQLHFRRWRRRPT